MTPHKTKDDLQREIDELQIKIDILKEVIQGYQDILKEALNRVIIKTIEKPPAPTAPAPPTYTALSMGTSTSNTQLHPPPPPLPR
jgi:hypothetical protein